MLKRKQKCPFCPVLIIAETLQHILKKIEINILPLAISIGLILISFGITMSTNKIFSSEHYIGMGCLLISAILYVANRKFYFLFFALTLTVGLLGLLDFYITTFKVGFAGFGINPIFLGLMILFFAVSKEQMDNLSSEKTESNESTLNENLIKSFESKFKDKTIVELNEIADENSKFTDEAKAAAIRRLKNKNVL